MTQLAVIQDIFARYGVENFHPVDGKALEDSANFMVFFGIDDVLALINWKTLAEDLKKVGVVDDGADIRSWRYDEIHGYFIHLSKSEISRLNDLKGQINVENNNLQIEDSTSSQEEAVLQKLHFFGYRQISSISFIKKSRFGDNLWRLDFKLNRAYSSNKKVIEGIVSDFSDDLLRYADICGHKVGNLKRWHFNKKDHHPVAFLTKEEMEYFLISLDECDARILPIDDYVNQNQDSNVDDSTSGQFQNLVNDSENKPDPSRDNPLEGGQSVSRIESRGNYLSCKDLSVEISESNIFGNCEEVNDARIEYSEGNVCFIDPTSVIFLSGKLWEDVGGLSSKIYKQVKIDKKLIKTVNKKASYCGQSTVIANLIDSGLADPKSDQEFNVLPAICYNAAKGGHDFGVLHAAINLDFSADDGDNLDNLYIFFKNILTQIAIDDKFDEYKIPVIVKSQSDEDDNIRMLGLVASSFTKSLEEVVHDNLNLNEKSIILCCDNPENQKIMIDNFRVIEFSRFGS